MTEFQRIIKYVAIGLGFFIIVSIVTSILNFAGFFMNIRFGNEKRIDEKITENLSGIEKLDIELHATNMNIIRGSEFKINRINTKDNLRITNKNGTLTIEEKSSFFLNHSSNGTIELEVPLESELNRVTITMGAGKFTAENLEVSKFDLEQGAGTVKIKNCKFDNTNIDGGAGKIDINNSTLGNLDLDSGVGSANIEAYLYGKNDIDVGVGSLNLELLVNSENYTITADKGLGSLKIDDKDYSSSVGNGPNVVDIDGGVGSILVKFKD